MFNLGGLGASFGGKSPPMVTGLLRIELKILTPAHAPAQNANSGGSSLRLRDHLWFALREMSFLLQ